MDVVVDELTVELLHGEELSVQASFFPLASYL